MRVAILLLSVIVSGALAGEVFGLFGCPSFRPGSTINTNDMTAYETIFKSYFPLRLYAAAENSRSARYSCITWGAIDSDTSIMTYYKRQTSIIMGPSKSIKMEASEISITWKLTKRGLMGSPGRNKDMTYYLVDDTGDFLTFKGCITYFMHHYVRTYTFLKSGADKTKYEWRCIIDALYNQFDISSVPKGICS